MFKTDDKKYSFFRKALLTAVLQGIFFFGNAQTDVSKVGVIEKYVVAYKDVTRMKFINDSMLYTEGWHTLPQPKFWQQIMLLSPDSAIVSLPANRQILDRIDLKEWNKLSDIQHNLYRDSIRRFNNIPDSMSVLVTGGKKDFYEYKKVMPTINRSIDVFKQ